MSKRNEKCHRERIACPMAIFLLLGILIFPMQCAFGSRGFASAEVTRGHENKRSLRSPSGLLRPPFGSYSMVMLILLVSAQKVHKLKTFDKDQETWVCSPKGARGRSQTSAVFTAPRRLRRGETPAAHGAVSSSSMPFALIVSGRRSIHTAIISTAA